MLHGSTRAGVDQRRSTGLLQGLQHLRHWIPRPPLHGVAEVRPPGGADLHQRTAQVEQPQDVGPYAGGRRGTQRQHGHPRTQAADQTEAAVIGPEIVAPGADAMGLIHGQGHETPLRGVCFQHALGRLSLQALRGEIQQPEGCIPQRRHRLLTSAWIQSGMETGSGNPPPLQLKNLVLHQRHERRNHHHQALPDESRQLIAKGFSTSGGQHSQRIPSAQDGFHHRALTRPETRPTEMGVESGLKRIHNHQI